MANMNYEQALGGLDEADASEGKFPPLEAEHEHICEVVETKFFESKKDERLIWLQEVTVVKSTCAAAVGKMRTDMVYDVKGPHKKLRLGQLKAQIAALLGYDPAADQKWIPIAAQVAEKNACKGFRYKCVTGPRTKTAKGANEFTPRAWSTPDEGDLGERQKQLFAKRKAG